MLNLFSPLSLLNNDDDLFWMQHHAPPSLFRWAASQQPPQRRCWSTGVELPEFKQEDISWKWKEGDDSKIVVDAKKEAGDDLSHIRRVVEVPTNVDRETLKTKFYPREGVLVLKANYKQQEVKPAEAVAATSLFPVNQWGPWGSLSEDMQRIQTEMQSMIDQSFPGTALTRFLKNDADGQHSVQVDFDVSGYKPEEVDIKLNEQNRLVTVEAKHDEKTDNGGRSFKHLRREFLLPNNADLAAIKSSMLQQGDSHRVLRLDVPCKVPANQLTNGEEDKKGPTGDFGVTETPMEITKH